MQFTPHRLSNYAMSPLYNKHFNMVSPAFDDMWISTRFVDDICTGPNSEENTLMYLLQAYRNHTIVVNMLQHSPIISYSITN